MHPFNWFFSWSSFAIGFDFHDILGKPRIFWRAPITVVGLGVYLRIGGFVETEE